MMIFDDPYYSFDMFQRRLRDISKQYQRKASEWFSGRYGARLTGIPVSALWNDSYVRTMNALHILRNEYPRKAIDAVAMDYLNGTFPAFVSPRMSETLIGLHASIDGGKALEPLADAVGYVNGHAVPNPATTDGYGQTITAAELMLSMIGKTETKAFWRDDDNDGSAGKAVMADAMNIIRDACDAFLTLMDTGIIGCTDIIHTLGACKEYGSDWRDRMGMLVVTSSFIGRFPYSFLMNCSSLMISSIFAFTSLIIVPFQLYALYAYAFIRNMNPCRYGMRNPLYECK